MNSLIAIAIATAFFSVTGWYLTYFQKNIHRFERLGLAFLLGAGLTTFLWFLGSLIGLPLNLLTLLLSGVILGGIGYLLIKLLKLSVAQSPSLKLGKAEKYLAAAVITSLLISFLIGSYNPLTAWDSIALYDFRGHAVAIDHDLSFSRAGAYFMSYPLMISLLHAVVYQLGGISAQGIHAIIFASLIAIVFGRLKEWSNLKYALLTCLLIIGQNEIFTHSTIAYTNLPYTSYLIAGLLYAVSTGPYTLLLSGLLLGLSGWVRSSEVFWIVGILLILWQGIRHKQKLRSIISIFLILIIRLTWSKYMNSVYASFGHITQSTVSHFTLASLNKIIANWQAIYWYLYLNVISPYLGIWFLAVPVSIVAAFKKSRLLFMLLSSIIISAGMVVVGVMIFSTYYTSWNEIGDSARRMVLFIIPLTLITAVYALYLVFSKKNEQ
jgi:hypothetical protein